MKEQVSELQNYMITLIEQLRYQLTNLNTSNWNDTAMKDFQKATVKDVAEELTKQAQMLKEFSESLEKLTERLGNAETSQEQTQTEVELLQKQVETAEQRLQQTETDIAWLEAGQETQNQRLDELEEDRDALQIVQVMQQEQIDNLESAVKSEEDAVTVGDGTRPLRLVGEIYINGVKLELEGSNETA